MGFSRRLAYLMVHTLGFTNKEANALISSGEVQVDQTTVHENCLIEDSQEIVINGEVLRPAKKYIYLKFNKPKGFQSSLNPNVPHNLSVFFESLDGLAIAGRLDMESEGLLLLSNDGKWIEKICNPKSQKEKEYIVVLDRIPDEDFCKRFSEGVLIGKHLTRPCICESIAELSVRIILTEGKNRQIRRMVKKLGAEVVNLRRVRIDVFELGSLAPGCYEYITN